MMELGTTHGSRRADQRSQCSAVSSSRRRSGGGRTFCMADSSGTSLTYGRALVGEPSALALAAEACGGSGQHRPAAALVGRRCAGEHRDVTLSGKVAVNLNFTAGHESMAYAIRALRHPHDSHVARLPVEGSTSTPLEGMVFLEDVLRDMTPCGEAPDARAGAHVLPAWALKRLVVPAGQRRTRWPP